MELTLTTLFPVNTDNIMVSLSVAEGLCEATALETEALETMGSWLERSSLSPIKPSVFVCLQVQRTLNTDPQNPHPHLQLVLKLKASWKKHVCWESFTQTLHLGPNCRSERPLEIQNNVRFPWFTVMDSLLDRSVATRRGRGHLLKRVDDIKNDSWMLQYQATKYKCILMIQSSDTDRVHPLTVNWGCKSFAYVNLLKWHNGLCDMNYFFYHGACVYFCGSNKQDMLCQLLTWLAMRTEPS